MKIALLVVGVLIPLWAVLTYHLYRIADRPGDDFGVGIMFWLAMLLLVLLMASWLILAAIHWWPK